MAIIKLVSEVSIPDDLLDSDIDRVAQYFIDGLKAMDKEIFVYRNPEEGLPVNLTTSLKFCYGDMEIFHDEYEEGWGL